MNGGARGLAGPVPLGLGCGPLGGLYAPVEEAAARATIEAALDGGIRLFDVAPFYGLGLAEERLGAALAGHPRDRYVLSTKVGRVLRDAPPPPELRAAFPGAPARDAVFDFSRDGVLRSLASSLERLRTDQVDVVHLHDPDDHLDEALAEAVPTLLDLRDQGVIAAVGAGSNRVAPLLRLVQECDLDCVLVAGRLTLLDRSAADELLPLCALRGVDVLAAGVFNSGVLADPSPDARFDYQPAAPEVIARARRLADVCAAHGVALPDAALRFALRFREVRCLLVGARRADEVRVALSALTADIPDELWTAVGAPPEGRSGAAGRRLTP